MPPGGALAAVLAGTACMGLGFGISGAPLNGLPPLFFPHRRHTALVAPHTLLGQGLAVGPLIASPFIMAGTWVGFPLLLAGLCGALVIAVLTERFRSDGAASGQGEAKGPAMAMAHPMRCAPGPRAQDHPAREAALWLFAVIAVLNAFADGTFGNWAVLYLQDVKHLPETVAAAGLSVFWAAMVGARLLTSLLVLRVAPSRWAQRRHARSR